MKTAVLTMAYNEAFFLPLWVHHYGEAFGYENLFIVDDASDDGSTGALGAANIMRKPRGLFDEYERADLISLLQMGLLRSYDCVIYTDTDEFIVADPATGKTLKQYLEAEPGFDFKTVTGFNVLHRTSEEKPFDISLPVFRQRHFIQFSIGYTKPLITRTPLRWLPGFHGAKARPRFDMNLLLFHLRTLDMDVAMERLRIRNTVQFSPRSLEKNHGFHFRQPAIDHLRMIGHPVADDEFLKARPGIDFVGILLGDYLSGKRLVDQIPEVIARVPERFADSLVLGRPPAFAPAVRPTIDPQALFEGAMSLVPRQRG